MQPAQRRSLRGPGALAAGLLTATIMTSGCASDPAQRSVSPAPEASPACVAPAGATLKDLDPADSPETPFAAPAGGEEQVIHVENVNLARGLWSQVEEGAAIWSASPCVELVTGPCPDQAPCVRVRAHPRRVLKRIEPDGGWGDTDGTFTGRERGGVRIRGRISLNLTMFANTSANGRLATISHELGHALGLVHRLDRSDVMHAETGDNTDPIPDQVDFANVLVLYGSQD